MEHLIMYERPELVQPHLVMGFEGWPDAGRVSSGVITFLRDKLRARRLADVRPDDFYIVQCAGADVRRPLTDIEGGLVKGLTIPSTSFWFHKAAKGGHDLIISHGLEPELSWNRYVDVIVGLAQDFGVERLLTVGGTYDAVPHTAEPVISAVLSHAGLKEEMTEYGIGFTAYEGPSSIHTALVVAAGRKGIKAASLWGHVPQYIHVPNAKVCYAILRRLTGMLDIAVDLDDMRKASEYLDEQVTKALGEKTQLSEYVAKLEEEYAKGRGEAGELRAEDIIKDVEDFLRKGKHED